MFLPYKFKKFGNAKKALQGKFFVFAVMVLLGANVFCATEKTIKYDSLMKTGTAAEIKKALKKDSDMVWVKIEPENDTLLMRAIMYNRDISVIDLLLKAGVPVKKENIYGQNALMYVCMYSKNTAVITKILEKSTTPKTAVKELNRKDVSGKSALNYAKEFENRRAIDCVSKYVGKPEGYQEGQDYVEFLEDLNEKLIQAEKEAELARQKEAERLKQAEQEKLALAQKELEQKTEITEPEAEVPASNPIDMNKYNKISLFDFAVQDEIPEPEETNDKSSEKIENPDKKDRNGRTALMRAAKNGDTEEINLLLKSNANVNLCDNDGWTALMNAARYQNDPEIIRILLEAGANPNQKNKYGSTALHLAAAYTETPEILRQLVKASKNSDEIFKSFIMTITSNSTGEKNQTSKIKVFIDEKVPVNRFYEGRTPLMYAAEYSASTEVIRFLLDNGAAKNLHSTDGKTAFDFAESNKLLKHDKIFWSLNQQ